MSDMHHAGISARRIRMVVVSLTRLIDHYRTGTVLGDDTEGSDHD
jgi:hypothetical protein